MKNVLVLAMAFFFSAAVFAQDKTGKMDDKMKKDCVMMKDGKMMVMKDGKSMMMKENMTMENGTMVMTDGSVKMKDGSTKMMENGQCVYMDGEMGKMEMGKMHGKKKKME